MNPNSSPPTLELSSLEAEKKEAMAGEEGQEKLEGGPEPSSSPPAPSPAPPGEKNGLVLKISAEEEEEEEGEALRGRGAGGGPASTFTGLGKAELLAAASTPPWGRARTFLLVLFWGGWLGMLGAAAAIVVRAPRCRALPAQSWWQQGALYRAPPEAFGGELRGVASHLEHVASLGVRGLVLGPVHPKSLPGDPKAPSLQQLDPALGTLEDFGGVLKEAKKRGLNVILDVTPNPLEGAPAWLGPEVARDPQFQQQVKQALEQWLERGVSGFFMDGIEELEPSVLADWRNLTEQKSSKGKERVLLGGSRLLSPSGLLQLLNSSQLSFFLGRFLEALAPQAPTPGTLLPQLLSFLHPQTQLAWTVGSPWQHLAELNPSLAAQRLLLLWTLPGTPTLNYGDELGLRDPQQGQLTAMPWELLESPREGDNSTQLLELCRHLGALRARERSLALGDAEAIPAGPAEALLRSWDQNERFLLLLNPGGTSLPPLPLQDPRLPPQLTLRLSTHRPFPKDTQVELGSLELLPYEGMLLSFPYSP